MELLAKNIANHDNGISQTDVIDCLIARERLGSTGIGNGIAIPHGRLKHCKKRYAKNKNNWITINFIFLCIWLQYCRWSCQRCC